MSLGQGALLCLLTSTAIAQDAPYHFDRWTTENGLPQNTVNRVIQTRDGYVWVATFDGLARFDGVRFTVFDKGNSSGINSNRFMALYETGDGTLLMGTEDAGLTTYCNGVFNSYTTADGLPSNRIFGILPDLDGEPLITTAAGRAYLRGGKIVPAPPAPDGVRYYRGPSGAQVTMDASGTTRVLDGRVTHYAIACFPRKNQAGPLTPYEDRRGNLWIRDGVNLHQLRDGQITSFQVLPAQIHPCGDDADGGLWLGRPVGQLDVGDVLARFKGGRLTRFGEADGVLKSAVNSIISDREGSIWIGTSRGLYRARKRLMTAYSTESGLASNEVYPLLQTRDGQIWVGTTEGLNRVRFTGGKFQSSPPILPGAVIQSLWEDPSGRVWIGSVGGLRRYENGEVQHLSELVNGATVYDVKSDREGTYWVASEKGVFRFDGGKVLGHYTTKEGLPGDDVKVIHQDRRGTLWFGTYGGLARFEGGRFISYTAAQGLAGNRVRAIHEDEDGTFWIGTYDDGLSRFRDGKFFNYRTENGLFNNGVFRILEDRYGHFWISCNKGIFRVSRRELNELAEGRISRINSVVFGKDDGMLNTECNGGRQPAGFIASDGKLWFPTMDGVVAIDPDAAQVNLLPPPVTIESVTLERKQIDFSRGVVVAPGQHGLEISYTALTFIKPEQVTFKYKLEGLDEEWMDVGARRVAYFPDLSPGDYRFQVMAANSDGAWSTVDAGIDILVEPPFWRTWWFIALASLSGAALVYLAFRQRVARLAKANAAQEAFSRRLLDSQERERQRIAAELHDSLGQSLLIIKNRAFLASGSLDDREQAREQLDEITSATTQAIEEVREIAYNLRPYQLDRFGLTRTLEAIFLSAADTSGIRFSAAVQNIDGLFSNEAEIGIYRIVQESVNNILKHSRATEARLFIERNGRELQIRIQDNGRGFTSAQASAGGDPRGGGLGLIGMAERARMLGSSYTIDSAPGRGTVIALRFQLPRPGPAIGTS